MSDIVDAREQDLSVGPFPVGGATPFWEKLGAIGMEPEPGFWLPRTPGA